MDTTQPDRPAFLDGSLAMAPILLGIVPFGLIAGISTVAVGLTPLHGVGMSVLVFAGAAQLAALQLIGTGAPFLVVAATALIINARHVMYSASLAPQFRDVSAGKKVLASYLLTDQAYALSIRRFTEREEPTNVRLLYFLGSGTALWVTWQISTAVGAFLGASIPSSWSLDFAIPLVFIALLIPAIRDRSDGISAGIAGVLAVLLVALPYNLGLPLAATTGIIAGVLHQRGRGRS